MFDQVLQNLLPSMEHFHYLGYWLAFFAAFLETAFIVGLLLPGSTLILVLGALSAGGYLDFGDLLWFAAIGAILGDNLNYWLGRRYGQQWLHNGVWFLKQSHFDQAQQFFDNHGARSIFVGRFIPSVKELVPFVAGTMGMQRRTFMIWNTLGAIGWGLEWLGAGYLFAQSLNLAQVWLSRTGLLLSALLIFSFFLLWFKRFIFRQGQQWLFFVASLWHSIKTAISTNPETIKLVQNHPKLFTFFENRLDRYDFYGLPLTLLCLAFIYILILFGGIVEDMLSSGPIVAIDHSLAQIVATLRTPGVVDFFVWITELGVWQTIIPSSLIVTIILVLSHRRRLITGLFASVIGSTIFTSLGKLAFHRPRPIEAVLVEHSYSFPSGHATIAVAFYGFLGYLLIRNSHSWKARVNWFFVSLVLILLIGLSRIILGAHYLSDVWAGYLVGTLWLIIGISLNEWSTARGEARTHTIIVESGRKKISASLIVMAFIGYGTFAALYQPDFLVPQKAETQQISSNLVLFLKSHLPEYTETALGRQQQPLGIVLIAQDLSTLQNIFNQAGWQQAGQLDGQEVIELWNKGLKDDHVPLVPTFWNKRINDLAFEKSIPATRDKRIVAIQIWKTPYRTNQGNIFLAVSKILNGIRWRILYSIDPDLDAARDAVLRSFKAADTVRTSQLLPFTPAMVGETLTGQKFFTRGQLIIITLAAKNRVSGKTKQGEPNKI